MLEIGTLKGKYMDHAFQKLIVKQRKQTVKLQQNSVYIHDAPLSSLEHFFYCLTAFLSFRYQPKCHLPWPPSPKHISCLPIHCHYFSQCSVSWTINQNVWLIHFYFSSLFLSPTTGHGPYLFSFPFYLQWLKQASIQHFGGI